MNEVLTNGSRPNPPQSFNTSSRLAVTNSEIPNTPVDSEIRCICGYVQDDGFTIQCDRCAHWQHGICVHITEKNVPDDFVCNFCEPRPVDAKRAQEIQRKRIEAEMRKFHIQPKTTAGKSHRRKETNGTSHARTHSESTSHIDRKPPSPKEHSTASKNRGRPRPNQNHTNLPDTSASPDHRSPSGKSPSVDREVSLDSEVPPSIYTKEYSPISSNTIVSPDVDHKIRSWTHDAQVPIKSAIVATEAPSLPCVPRRYTTAELQDLIPPGHTVRWVSSPDEFSSLGLPLIRLVADEPAKPDQFVIEYVGEIGSKSSYIQDTLNQYQRIRHPKPFVLFHPQLPIYIDARRCGSEARFVRRSCKPNLTFETMIIDGTELRFAFYTNNFIERGIELTIGWEWDPSLPLGKVLDDEAFETLDPSELAKMTTWAEIITANVGECACADRSNCIMARLKGEFTTGKSKSKSHKSGKKRPFKEISENVLAGRELSPEKHDLDAINNKRRSSSISSNRKSESRDRTPTFPSADITQTSVLTDQHESAREARKMKDAISLIEKLTNPEVGHSRKKVKRPSAGAATLVPPTLHNGYHDILDKLKGYPATPAVPSNGQILPDAGSSTQSSPKMTNGNHHRHASPQASYVEYGTQTDVDVPHNSVASRVPSCRKKRILAMFRAQNQQRERSLKPQLSIVKEEPTSNNVNVEIDQDIDMDDIDEGPEVSLPVRPLALDQQSPPELPSDSTIQVMDANIVKPSPPSPPSDFSPDQPFSKLDLLNGNHVISSDILSNAYRNANFHVQMPTTPSFPNAPTTPALLGTQRYAFPTPNGSVQSPVSPFNSSMNGNTFANSLNSLNQPLPTPPPYRKKMSLSEYSRRKAESTTDKEKPTLKGLPSVTDTETEANGASVLQTKTESSAMDLDPPAASMNI